MSTRCGRPGCSGAYGPEGYCDECGRRAPRSTGGSGAASRLLASAAGGAAAPPVSGGSAGGPTSVPASTGTVTSVGTGSGAPSGSGARSSRAGTRRPRGGRAAAGLLDLPRIPARDPAAAVLANPQVPQSRRYCGNPDCGRPVGRDRDGTPGRVEGFCPACRTPFSFVPRLQPGTLVAGRYEVTGCLAHGGLGWIYLARDRNVGDEVSNRWVVLKGLIDTGDPDAMAAAVAERRFLVEVDHPGIVKIYDFVSHPDRRAGRDVGYIVMEYIGGRSLKDIRVDRTRADGAGPLPVDQVIAYGLEILPAFGYLHDRGLLYCDFKPDNAIHTDDRLKLVDLGAVRRIDDDVSPVWGTVGYQAPEVATRGPSVAADLYTVGRTLAVLSLDFKGFSSAYVDRLPDPGQHPVLEQNESYHRFLRRATHHDPDQRFGSAAEMAEQLHGVLCQLLAEADGVPRPIVSTQFTAERHAFGTAAGMISAGTSLDRLNGTTTSGGTTNGGTAQPAATPLDGADGLDGPAIAAALPLPQLDPADPGAAVLLAVPDGNLKGLIAASGAAPQDSVELPLALIRAHITHGDLPAAAAALHEVAARDPYDWRVSWYRGLHALAGGDHTAALGAFDAVYDALPGELAPQLALAVAAETTGDTGAALRRYRRVWSTDRGYGSAAFGTARILLRQGDPAGAITVLDAVPTSSSDHLTAQIAAARARLRGNADTLSAGELTDAAARLERLRLDAERHATLTIELLGAALQWARRGRSDPSGRLLGHPLTERGLRFGLERAYRTLAKVAPDAERRIALVDSANQIRPRTWL